MTIILLWLNRIQCMVLIGYLQELHTYIQNTCVAFVAKFVDKLTSSVGTYDPRCLMSSRVHLSGDVTLTIFFTAPVVWIKALLLRTSRDFLIETLVQLVGEFGSHAQQSFRRNVLL